MEQRVYKRIWCKSCNDFTIHELNTGEKLQCNYCGTEYTNIYLKEIPKDKLELQRERYKFQQRRKYTDLYTGFLTNGLNELFEEPGKPVILESDAGQEDIDTRIRQERAKRMAEYREKQEKKKQLQEKFKNTHRNDKCLCGSGLKYKYCCLKEIRSL